MRENIAARVLRRIISRMANLTPSVIYYPKGWPAKINGQMFEIASRKGSGSSPLSLAAVSMAFAMHEYLPSVGDAAEIKLTGVTRHSTDVGDFVVNVKRIASPTKAA